MLCQNYTILLSPVSECLSRSTITIKICRMMFRLAPSSDAADHLFSRSCYSIHRYVNCQLLPAPPFTAAVTLHVIHLIEAAALLSKGTNLSNAFKQYNQNMVFWTNLIFILCHLRKHVDDCSRSPFTCYRPFKLQMHNMFSSWPVSLYTVHPLWIWEFLAFSFIDNISAQRLD